MFQIYFGPSDLGQRLGLALDESREWDINNSERETRAPRRIPAASGKLPEFDRDRAPFDPAHAERALGYGEEDLMVALLDAKRRPSLELRELLEGPALFAAPSLWGDFWEEDCDEYYEDEPDDKAFDDFEPAPAPIQRSGLFVKLFGGAKIKHSISELLDRYGDIDRFGDEEEWENQAARLDHEERQETTYRPRPRQRYVTEKYLRERPLYLGGKLRCMDGFSYLYRSHRPKRPKYRRAAVAA